MLLVGYVILYKQDIYKYDITDFKINTEPNI